MKIAISLFIASLLFQVNAIANEDGYNEYKPLVELIAQSVEIKE